MNIVYPIFVHSQLQSQRNIVFAMAANVVCNAPTTADIRAALPSCYIPELRCIAECMKMPMAGLRHARRQLIIDTMRTFVDGIEHSGGHTFDRDARIKMCISTVRPHIKRILKLDEMPTLRGDAQHTYPRPQIRVSVALVSAAARRMPATPRHSMARHSQPTIIDLVGATPRMPGSMIYTLLDAFRVLPFYRYPADIPLHSYTLTRNEPKTVYLPARRDNQRVVFVFTDIADAPGTRAHTVWVDPYSTVSVNTTVIKQRGPKSLPIDITAMIPETPSAITIRVSTEHSEWKMHQELRFHVLICDYDASAASGDVAEFLSRRAICAPSSAPAQSDDTFKVQQERVSIMCPLTLSRVSIPGRTTECKHAQCFDIGSFFMQNAMLSTPRWKCPICNTSALPSEVVWDGRMAGVLDDRRLPSEAEQIIYDRDTGQWELDRTYSIVELGSASSSCDETDPESLPFNAETDPEQLPDATTEPNPASNTAVNAEQQHASSIAFWTNSVIDTPCTRCHKPLILTKGVDEDTSMESDGVCMICKAE